MNLLKLASAKFPPEQTPALLKDMEVIHAAIAPTQGEPTLKLQAELRDAFISVVVALQGIKENLTFAQDLDSVLVDTDFDSAGYGILEIVEGKARVATSKQIQLNGRMTQQASDVKIIRDIFALDNAKGRDIFSLPYQEEFNAVEIVLARSKKPGPAAAIVRLGLQSDFERLTECHAALQAILGIGVAPDGDKKPIFAQFEESMKKLIFAVGLYANEDTEEHKQIRATLLGPYEKHTEIYRERQRRHAENRKTEPTPPAPTTPTSTD